jgi:hypothetical protein
LADISDVENALCDVVLGAVYPGGTQGASITGQAVKIYRGWPNSTGLNQDIGAGNQIVTVTSIERGTVNTTRYAPVWKTVSARSPTITLEVDGMSCAISGSASAGDVVGIDIDGVAYAFAVQDGETATALAARLAPMIPGCVAVGGVWTFPYARALAARTAGAASCLLETRRQEQKLLVGLWCPDPRTRDVLARSIDVAFSSLDWLTLSDGTSARVVYDGTAEKDDAVNANVYRRDLLFRVEYATTITQATTRMLFGLGHVDDGVSSRVFDQTLPGVPVVLPRMGAVRFDAWYDPANPIDAQCADALSAPAFQNRLPANAVVTNGVASWPRATQAMIDAEIDAACRGGIGFWAFDSYASADTLSLALQLYLSSASRSRLGFCMLGQTSSWSTPEAAQQAIARDVALMSQPGYVTVLGGRPLYLLLDAQAAQTAGLGSGGVAGEIAQLRALAAATGVGDPYVVWLSGAGLAAYDNTVAALADGADAAGCYCCPSLDGDMQSYAALTEAARDDWQRRAQQGMPMIPTAMCGWDQRPLVERPQPFYPVPVGVSDGNYYQAGSPAEIGLHIAEAASFVIDNAAACPAQVGLIYAWNELAEGGWLLPTWTAGGPDESRVELCGAALSDLAAKRAASAS